MLLAYLILIQLTTNVIVADPRMKWVINVILLVIGTIFLFAPDLIHIRA